MCEQVGTGTVVRGYQSEKKKSRGAQEAWREGKEELHRCSERGLGVSWCERMQGRVGERRMIGRGDS